MASYEIIITKLVLCAFYIVTIDKFMKACFFERKSNKLHYIVWGLYYGLQVYWELVQSFCSVLTLLCNMIVIFLIAIVLYRDGMKKCICFSMLVCACWMLVEIIVVAVLTMCGAKGMELYLSASAISKVIMLAGAFYMKQYMRGKERWQVEGKVFFFMLFIPAGSIYMVHRIFEISAREPEYTCFSIVVSCILLLMNYVIFEVCEWIVQSGETKQKNQLYEQKLALCVQQVEDMTKKNQEIKRFQHDMKHHFITLLGMLEYDRQEEARKYIQDFMVTTSGCSLEAEIKSGNVVIDSLLNNIKRQAKAENISFTSEVFVPVQLPFRAEHITIILGNLIENALEACRMLKDAKRYMDVKIQYTKHMLMIRVENPYEGTLCISRQNKPVTKKKRAYHGIGLHSVEQAAKAYDGQLYLDWTGQIFTAVTILYENK